METVKVEFDPWVPYSAKDICEKLVNLIEELKLQNYSRWGLVMEFPMDETSWRFCKRMRSHCGVYIFSNE